MQIVEDDEDDDEDDEDEFTDIQIEPSRSGIEKAKDHGNKLFSQGSQASTSCSVRSFCRVRYPTNGYETLIPYQNPVILPPAHRSKTSPPTMSSSMTLTTTVRIFFDDANFFSTT